MGNIFTSVRKVQGGWGIVFMREGMCVCVGGGELEGGLYGKYC